MGRTRCAAQFRFPVGVGGFLSHAGRRPRVATPLTSRSSAGVHVTHVTSSTLSSLCGRIKTVMQGGGGAIGGNGRGVAHCAVHPNPLLHDCTGRGRAVQQGALEAVGQGV